MWTSTLLLPQVECNFCAVYSYSSNALVFFFFLTDQVMPFLFLLILNPTGSCGSLRRIIHSIKDLNEKAKPKLPCGMKFSRDLIFANLADFPSTLENLIS